MNDRQTYAPGPAAGAKIEKGKDQWTLVLVRDLRHAPPKVWQALTDPAQLKEWAPFDSDGLLTTGATVKLTTVGAPSPHVVETKIKRADAPKLLEFNWGGGDMRWELEPREGGTRLTLWANINRHYIAMGAAGWHICFDVLDRLLADAPIGRLAGPTVMQVVDFQRLHAEYATLLGVELPKFNPAERK
jgi:uncharacterized protein YndB with AHSA1/START domain